MSSNFVASNQTRSLRACMVCSIVQTQQRFIRDGCPNCETFLDLTNHADSVQECTSQVFEGLITLADPGQSWVAKWQRLDGYVAGVYAVKVVGMVSGIPTFGVCDYTGLDRALPDEVQDNIEAAGVRYIPRDGSAQDDDT
ncbi:MAG: transcription elongation factor spt-4 [Lasallia pustulata]|uniref:Transcription elongation factor SPT4 n=1 Tax=Lasallia pustulata TaxID=136370 RepID=A0A5M8PSQ5_9LECA|nr:MAG: transcription elongation factor spt-4 [Lasallia pustulata]